MIMRNHVISLARQVRGQAKNDTFSFSYKYKLLSEDDFRIHLTLSCITLIRLMRRIVERVKWTSLHVLMDDVYRNPMSVIPSVIAMDLVMMKSKTVSNSMMDYRGGQSAGNTKLLNVQRQTDVSAVVSKSQTCQK